MENFIPVKSSKTKTSWHGLAFLVEALVLLAFITASMAVFFSLFASSGATGLRSMQLTDATSLATNEAELFTANPAAYAQHAGDAVARNDLTLLAAVTPSKSSAGTLYEATFQVYRTEDLAQQNEGGISAQPVYTLSTSRYVSDSLAARVNGSGVK